MKNLDLTKSIWGFHVHQEVPYSQLSRALVTQTACKSYLESCNIKIDSSDVIDGGYGPHLNPMWELRVENELEKCFEGLGHAIAFMSINRFGLSGYIHPLRQSRFDNSDTLTQEGLLNQSNILWFGRKVPQNQDFFFNPPRDENGVLDTRTSRIFSQKDKESLLKQVVERHEIKDPRLHIKGFHIHMDSSSEESQSGLEIFEEIKKFMKLNSNDPVSTAAYEPMENGPHLYAGWEIKFDDGPHELFKKLGQVVGWLMCNRAGHSVFLHPVTWMDGDRVEELYAHEHYSSFLGDLPPLDLGFFKRCTV